MLRQSYDERTAAILQEFGQDGLNLTGKYGDDLAKIIDNLEPAEAKKAVNLINSYGDEAFDLFKEGKGADEVKKIVEGGLSESGSKTIDYVKLSDELGNKITLDGYKIINIKDATTANADWADMGYDLPPVAAGTKVYNVEAGNHKYARVFKEGVNKPKSPFILRADDIKGLSAVEIAEKYALPQIPDKIVYPKIPSDIPLEVSIVGPQESWGTLGGDVQYAIKDVFLDDDWFTDIYDLK